MGEAYIAQMNLSFNKVMLVQRSSISLADIDENKEVTSLFSRQINFQYYWVNARESSVLAASFS